MAGPSGLASEHGCAHTWLLSGTGLESAELEPGFEPGLEDPADAGSAGSGTLVGWLSRVLRGGRRASSDGDEGAAGGAAGQGWASRGPDPLAEFVLHHI